MKLILTILYSVLIPIIYILYLRGVKKENTTPNPITWIIWSGAGIVNAITYYGVTEGDIFKYLITVIAAICATMVVIYTMIKGKFQKFTLVDLCVAISVIGLLGYWWYEKNDRITNMLLQVIYLLSFIPTVYNIWIKDSNEYLPPYFVALVAYSLSIVVILLDWKNDWLQLAYPIANGLIGNGSVVISMRLKR